MLLCLSVLRAQKPLMRVCGRAISQLSQQGLCGVSVRVAGTGEATLTDAGGYFSISLPHRQHVSLVCRHLSYEPRVKELEVNGADSIYTIVVLKEKENILGNVDVYAARKPDTIAGSPRFSIFDFDFWEDRFILLTAERTLEKAELKLTDYSGKVSYTTKIPPEAGPAKELYHDYMGYTNLVCENLVYRVNVFNEAFVLIAMDAADYNAYVRPVVDTLNGKLIFSDYWKEYPLFSYYAFDRSDSSKKQLITIANEDLLQAYHFEYYAMKPAEKLAARRMAMDLHTDKRIIAALMTGFTKSMFYEPLYAPLFVLKDTLCVFDHYKDLLFHFDRHGYRLDSLPISYNHPKNWREWKRLMVKDDVENTIYAVYDRSGHKYLRQIDYRTGKDKGLYNLQFYSADKIRVRDGYAYYIYRPFESTQQKFLYRELVKLESK